MICSFVNLLRFKSVSFAGEQTNLKVRAFQGSRSPSVFMRTVFMRRMIVAVSVRMMRRMRFV
jgi:hypothetical protein